MLKRTVPFLQQGDLNKIKKVQIVVPENTAWKQNKA